MTRSRRAGLIRPKRRLWASAPVSEGDSEDIRDDLMQLDDDLVDLRARERGDL